MGVLAGAAAVAAVVLVEHADVLDVYAVDLRELPKFDTGAVVSLQMNPRPSGSCAAPLGAVARAAVALGFDHIALKPYGEYVQVVAVGEVATPAGSARVEAWDHLTGDHIGQAAAMLGVALDCDTGPVHVAVADVLRLVESPAVA
ncbi:hypothetical protein [Saccharothrix deserti]|uniref:hypothetical protein n=1 Tax=Saccharothrix deserti TaxID=2593674 RepID=UPI00131B5D1C|nr:hypothetical protein [Saccharothrix deserti]